MKKLLMLPAIVLGAASLVLSASAVAANYHHRTVNPVTGLATGVLNAGGTVITGVGQATVGVASGVAHGTAYFANGVARTTTGALGLRPAKGYHRHYYNGTTVRHSH